jgi:uncharacterized protein YdhG (YjbR/CyaY superfamily)
MKQNKTVDAYLASVPEAARITLEKVRRRIRAAVPPGSAEGLSYGMPAFKQQGKALVAYAAFKNHCSLFPMSGAVIAMLEDELSAYTTSKGTIQFPIGEPLPATLIKKVVKARLAERAAAKKGS